MRLNDLALWVRKKNVPYQGGACQNDACPHGQDYKAGERHDCAARNEQYELVQVRLCSRCAEHFCGPRKD